MGFINKLPEWKQTGTEPSADLKTNGFKAGQKPPAGVFNWFWSLVSKAITELQNKAVEKGNLLNADLNEAIVSGIYRFNVPVANKPPITYGQLLVLHGEGDTIAQIAFGYEGKVYYRAGNPVSVGGNGDWTDWIRIYDGKSTVPISQGGTGATTAAGALSTLGAAAAKHKGQHNRLNGVDPVSLSDVAYFGMNPIDFNDKEADTIQNWVDKGSGYCYYAKEGDFGVQPSRYGQLVNLITGADVFQIWHTLPKGANYIRSGSGTAGWVSGWVKVYDEENKPTPDDIGALPTTGGTLTGNLKTQNADIELSRAGGTTKIFTHGSAPVSYWRIMSTNGSIAQVALNEETGKILLGIGEDADNINYAELNGEHNKPRGIYTGSQNALQRTITISDKHIAGWTLLVTDETNELAFVTSKGAFVLKNSGGTLNVSKIAFITFKNGVLTTKEGDNTLNGANTTYYYQVL